ncbi:MAG TPA: cyclic-di-AMP receptor [Anaerolineales bacterium]|nr:cyclic-di-AMP receptor [Anaerolineales bacterium]
MKMMILIVKDSDSDAITQALTSQQYRVTRIASTGGFLRSGVVTLLLGVLDDRVEAALELIRAKLPPLASGEKRATLFVVPVERFEQI